MSHPSATPDIVSVNLASRLARRPKRNALTTERIAGPARLAKDVDWSSAHEARPNILFGRTPGGNRISLRVDGAVIVPVNEPLPRRSRGMFIVSTVAATAAFDRRISVLLPNERWRILGQWRQG